MKSVKMQGVCSSKLLDTESLPSELKDILDNRLQEVFPFTALPKLITQQHLEFYIEPSSVDFNCLQESFLTLRISIVSINATTGQEEKLEPGKDISILNFPAQMLFSGLRIYIQDEPIMDLHENYAYEMYVNTLLHMSTESQRAYLGGALWNPTQPGHFWINTPKIPAMANPELMERGNAIAESKTLPLVSPILSGMFMVPRLLPPNIELRFIFNFNHPNFSLIAPEVPLPSPVEDAPAIANAPPSPPKKKKSGGKGRSKRYAQSQQKQQEYNIKIESAKLYLQKYRLTVQAQIIQENLLKKFG
ncbi:MAG: hypothetical protein GY858_08760, partial [Candidatus Omnitrophica bacterium]|nr:hypothetical protein [Candidatus Omnitrophota bacterium]